MSNDNNYKDNIEIIDDCYIDFIRSSKNNDSKNPFKESTYRILYEIEDIIYDSITQKLMLITVLTLRGIEKGELYPEVEALIKELIQNNTLEQVKSEISQEDYELIKKDIEFIREKLKI